MRTVTRTTKDAMEYFKQQREKNDRAFFYMNQIAGIFTIFAITYFLLVIVP